MTFFRRLFTEHFVMLRGFTWGSRRHNPFSFTTRFNAARQSVRFTVREIAPEEIFLDSANLPRRDELQFEGRVVKGLGSRTIVGLGVICSILSIIFLGRTFDLGVVQGKAYAAISRDNRLERSVLFATRGLLFDRTGRELASNVMSNDASSSEFLLRTYRNVPGLSLLVGFVSYPKADDQGVWWREEESGVSGIEQAFNDALAGTNGATMVETDARHNIEQQNIIAPPQHGRDITLSIDSDVQSKIFSLLSAHAATQHFSGGAAAIMDVHTGELLALTSFPEYDHQSLVHGDAAKIRKELQDPAQPFLNRAVSGLYAPGSIVKPILAAAALREGIITPETMILSTGAITIPNLYDPENPSIFKDWTVHGLIDMREALAVSSDEYFYTIGGGYRGQRGLGIKLIDEYARKFGLGAPTGVALSGEEGGVIPTPEWKLAVFGADDPWRIGDTYHTAIGQYGFQITPIQAVSFIAAIANGGHLMRPSLLASSTAISRDVGIPDSDLAVVREGMRLAVNSDRKDATVKVLNMPGIAIAAKTGTAQVGERNQFMNSWSVGFWPADNPKYAYAAVLEKAPAGTLSGAAPALRPFFEWLISAHPEYVN